MDKSAENELNKTLKKLTDQINSGQAVSRQEIVRYLNERGSDWLLKGIQQPKEDMLLVTYLQKMIIEEMLKKYPEQCYDLLLMLKLQNYASHSEDSDYHWRIIATAILDLRPIKKPC